MLNKKILLALLFLSVGLMLADCRCKEQQIMVKSVLLEIPANASGLSKKLDKEAFASLVKKTISKNAHFRFNEEYLDGGQLRLTLHLPAENNSPSALVMLAHLALTVEGKAKEYRSFASIEITDGSIHSSDISKAIGKVLQHLYQLQSGRAANVEEYMTKVDAAILGESIDQSDLMNAIGVLGDVKEKAAVPSLVKLMAKTNNLAIGNACLIALSEIGTDEAMPAIIDFVERKPPIIRRQAIIAARRIASQLAASWLLVMAYGYDDLQVQKEAMAALEEVEKKLQLTAK